MAEGKLCTIIMVRWKTTERSINVIWTPMIVFTGINHNERAQQHVDGIGSDELEYQLLELISMEP